MDRIRKMTMAVAGLMLVAAAACQKVDEMSPAGDAGSGRRVEMTFGLTTPGMSRPTVSIPLQPSEGAARGVEAQAAATAAATQAAATATATQTRASETSLTVRMEDSSETRATEEGTEEENKLYGVWVLQFEGTEGTAKLQSCEYYSADKITADNKLSVSLIEVAGTIRAYFVANVGENCFTSLSVGTTTLADFEAMKFDFAPTTTVPAGGLPMAGVFEGTTTASEGTISLERMVAKINFTCNVSLANTSEKFVVKSVQVMSAAAGSAYKQPTVPTGTSGLYPDASQAANFVDAALEEETQSSFTRTWYVAENLRGVVAGLTEKTKGGENAPAGSTCIAVTGDYTKGDETLEVTYSIYPGANAETDFNVRRNYIYTLTSNIKGMNETDLRVSVARGESLTVSGTANCYMVSQAGTTYKFDATVMGNGQPTDKYTASGSNTVSAPAITPTALEPVSAKVLWESGSAGSVIASGSVKLSGGEVSFTTAGSEGQAVAEGNAVIAVFDASDNILWSWHIWSTKYDPNTDFDTYTNYSKKSYQVMKYNLGASATAANTNAGIYGLYYQWGRKDPFRASAATTGATDATTTFNSELGGKYSWNTVATSASTGTVSYSIQHPTTFITGSDWITGDRIDNLWGNPSSVTTQPNPSEGAKSIYDPCPPGWRVPPQDTWTGFTSTGANSGTSSQFNVYGSFSNGWNFYVTGSKTGARTFYPAAGYRGGSSGALAGVGSYGRYWSSSPYSGSNPNAGRLNFHSSYVYPLNYNRRANGFSVRCVKE